MEKVREGVVRNYGDCYSSQTKASDREPFENGTGRKSALWMDFLGLLLHSEYARVRLFPPKEFNGGLDRATAIIMVDARREAADGKDPRGHSTGLRGPTTSTCR